MKLLELVGLVGVTLVVTHGTIFEGLRGWLNSFTHRFNFLRWLGVLLSCPQCSGFWVGALWAIALQKPWVTVFIAGGLVSVGAVVANFVFLFTSAAVDKASGAERNQVIQQLLEIRQRKKEELEAAKSKQATGDFLSEDEAHALMDEQMERADSMVG